MQRRRLDEISAGVHGDHIVTADVLPRCRIDLGRDAIVVMIPHVGHVILLDSTAQHVPCDQLARNQRHLRGIFHGQPIVYLCAA